jgi:hypothetical protein
MSLNVPGGLKFGLRQDKDVLFLLLHHFVNSQLLLNALLGGGFDATTTYALVLLNLAIPQKWGDGVWASCAISSAWAFFDRIRSGVVVGRGKGGARGHSIRPEGGVHVVRVSE